MIVIHDGPNLVFKQDKDTLILDRKWRGRLTSEQIDMLEKAGMEPVEEDLWYGQAKYRPEVERLVKLFDRDWVSRESERLAYQQMIGGR